MSGQVFVLAALLGISPEGISVESEPLLKNGIPVRGGFRAELKTRDGNKALWTNADNLPHAGPELTADFADIREQLTNELGLSPGRSSNIELVYLPLAGALTLAYEVALPLRLDGPAPSRQTRWYDVRDGSELLRREHVRNAHAYVFPGSPTQTPTPIEVELPGVSGTHLVSDSYQAYGCVSEMPDSGVPQWRGFGQCYPTRLATADSEGNFFVPLPELDFTDHRTLDDAYAEVSVYWHAQRFHSEMLARGWELFPCDQATLLVNFSRLSSDGGYVPFDNAVFTGECGSYGPTLIFGQGTIVDYAYDGDVIYHELGHGSVAAATPDGLWRWSCHTRGCSRDASAIAETIADYHTIMLTDEPTIAEYVAMERGGYRNADNDKSCPADITGEPHLDSEIFTGALWTMRNELGERVDTLVLELLPSLPPDLSFETYALRLSEFAEMSGLFASDELARIDEALDDRGLFDCDRVVTLDRFPRTQWIEPRDLDEDGRSGPAQLSIEFPAGVTEIRLHYSVAQVSDAWERERPGSLIRALVRNDGAPITFSGTGLDGDWDRIISPQIHGNETSELVFEAPANLSEKSTTLTIALVNTSPQDWVQIVVDGVTFETSPPTDSGCKVSSERASPWLLIVAIAALVRWRPSRCH